MPQPRALAHDDACRIFHTWQQTGDGGCTAVRVSESGSSCHCRDAHFAIIVSGFASSNDRDTSKWIPPTLNLAMSDDIIFFFFGLFLRLV